jgi:hypothetical protein
VDVHYEGAMLNYLQRWIDQFGRHFLDPCFSSLGASTGIEPRSAWRKKSVTNAAIEHAWGCAEESNIQEDPLTAEEQALGAIPIARKFEYQPDSEHTIISDRVAEEFSSYLEHISTEQFAGKRRCAVLKSRLVW